MAALLGLVAACGNGDGRVGAPPPLGFPTVGGSYDVVVEALAWDCTPGRRPPLPARRAVADVFQDGLDVEWSQDATGGVALGRAWLLEGKLVSDGNGAFSLRLRGDRSAVVEVDDSTCVGTVRVPASSDADPLTLELDACGHLRGSAWVEVRLRGEACERPATCRLRMRWTAAPQGGDPAETRGIVVSARRPCVSLPTFADRR